MVGWTSMMKRVEGFPPKTEEQRRELAALAALPDSAIDTSDIPEWTEQDFSDAMRLNGRTPSEAMQNDLRQHRTK